MDFCIFFFLYCPPWAGEGWGKVWSTSVRESNKGQWKVSVHHPEILHWFGWIWIFKLLFEIQIFLGNREVCTFSVHLTKQIFENMLLSRFLGNGRFDRDQETGGQFMKEFPRTCHRFSQVVDPRDRFCIEPWRFSTLRSEQASCCLCLLPFLRQSALSAASTSSNKRAFFLITMESFWI